MKYTKLISALALTTLMSGCVVIASSPSRADFHRQKELAIDARTLTAMDIETGSGSLIVKGVNDISEIKMTADIYTDKKRPDDFELTLTKSGNTALLVAKNHSTSGFWVGNSPRIDVVIEIPSSLMVDIEDGSGDIEVTNINNTLAINDGSGSIIVNRVNGDTSIRDNSGELTVEHIKGSLNIVDGSGDIYIDDIQGNLTLDDGSGSILAKNIDGSAEIEDGSGDLTVKHIIGTVTLDDGSGSIHVDNAGGLKILDAGSGGLKVNNVKGDFQIDS